MCLHYLVKLIARVLSPYITYFSIQVVNFWHQILTNCWNNSFQQLTTVSVVFTDIHHIFFASDYVNVTCFLQVCRQQNNNATELARQSSWWKKSHLILSHQVCGLPVVLILTPSIKLCNMGYHAGEGLQQGEDCKCWRTLPAHRGWVGTSWSAHYRQRSEGVVKTTASMCCCWRRTVWTWTVTRGETVLLQLCILTMPFNSLTAFKICCDCFQCSLTLLVTCSHHEVL